MRFVLMVCQNKQTVVITDLIPAISCNRLYTAELALEVMSIVLITE